jgi:hypothetical protein
VNDDQIRGASRDQAIVKRQLGESGRSLLGELMQFDLKRSRHRRRRFAQLSQLSFQKRDSTTKPSDLEGENLISSTAYVTQQGACHVSTFRVPEHHYQDVLAVKLEQDGRAVV